MSRKCGGQKGVMTVMTLFQHNFNYEVGYGGK